MSVCVAQHKGLEMDNAELTKKKRQVQRKTVQSSIATGAYCTSTGVHTAAKKSRLVSTVYSSIPYLTEKGNPEFGSEMGKDHRLSNRSANYAAQTSTDGVVNWLLE